MKKLNSFLSVLLSAVLVLSVFSALPLTSYAEDNSPRFEVESITSYNGAKNVAVNVNLKNNPGVASIALDVHYDESALTLTNFTYNTTALNGASTVPFSPSAKPPCLSMVNGTSNVTGDFTFATLYFDIKGEARGSYDISLTYDEDNVYDINEDNVEFKTASGRVTLHEIEEMPHVISNPYFEVDKVNAESGAKDVAVNVRLKDNTGIASAALDVHYDESALTLTNFSYNTEALNGASVVPFNASAKPPCISMVNGTANVTGDFIFATLYFDVADNANGTYEISLTYDEDNIYDIGEKNVKVNVINGEIEVSGTNPTDKTEPPSVQTEPVTETTEPGIGTAPAFEVGTVQAKSGEKNVAVNVQVKNNPGVASIALDIHYDESALTLTNFTYNTDALNGASVVPFNATAKPPCISMVNGTDNVSGDFIFATLYFDVNENASGSYTVSLSYDEDNVYNVDEDNVSFKVKNGSVNVGESFTEKPTVTETTEPTEPVTEKPTVTETTEPTEPVTEKPTVTETTEPTEPVTEKPTVTETTEPTEPDKLENGYYLVGSIKGDNSWNNNIHKELLFKKNMFADVQDEYMICGVELKADDEIKVVSVEDNEVTEWYPAGVGNNYVIESDGKYDIYFRPNGDGNSDWWDGFWGCYFYVEAAQVSTESEPTEPTTEQLTYIMGDVNLDGAVDVRDATVIQRYVAKMITLSPLQLIIADVNKDGGVDIRDATLIKRVIAKLDSFPG